jgi:putative tryptophan/tyrosine transport system substrate-binding protein
MRRRNFISLLGGAAAGWPLAARAQQGERMRRIGLLISTERDDREIRAQLEAFRQALRELGWTEGGNVRIDIRSAEGDADHIRTSIAELIGMSPDVLLGSGGPVTELRKGTSTIPIVFVTVPDPVELGLVSSLAQPGGNVTGFTHFELAMGGKWLELLKEISPSVRRVALLQNPEHPSWAGFQRTIKAAAQSFGVEVIPAGIHDAGEIVGAIEAFSREANGGLIVLPSPPTTLHRGLIVALAARHWLPAIYPFRYFVAEGGLISYGVDNLDMWRRSASYVNRILRGEKPADLPVQAPTKYELVINLKTAKSLGLTVPLIMQMTADGVIE